jgi:(S)-2-hydroxyglutarate dehydrogenase
VRSSVIDNRGFEPEALEIEETRSFHVLNYNSPGATGALAFSARIVSKLRERGYFANLTKIKDQSTDRLWDFEGLSID